MKSYRVILCDPPWPFKNKNTGGSMRSGSAQVYKNGGVLTLNEIANFPINRISHKNSLIFLWVPVALSVHEAPKIIEHWGYTVKTKIFWEKEGKIGMGFWWRSQVEELWVCKRGNIPALRVQEKNIISFDNETAVWLKDRPPCNLHSTKSTAARMIIDKAVEPFANLRNSKIELFSRERVHGWDSWGLESPVNDIELVYP